MTPLSLCCLLTTSRALTFSLIRTVASSKMPFYAVARGNKPGIYESWPECQKQIIGFGGARYKKFASKIEAEVFVQENRLTNPVIDRRTKNDKPASQGEAKPESKVEAPVASSSLPSGQMSPTLLKMKAEMKEFQKQLSTLRTNFDLYVSQKMNWQNSSSSSSAEEKRKHEDEDDENEESAGASKKLHTEGSGEGDDKTKFSTDSDGYLIIYTDGSCEFNGRNGAKAGVGVFFGHDHPLNVSEPVKGRATNNTAEIQAATFALELAQASGFSKVAVHTDSEFMINCMTSWLKGWKKKGWVKSDGKPVKNKEDLMNLDKAFEGLAVKWVYVKGHVGHEGNEMADKLAKTGAKLYKAEV